jgi:hypothetical protein
MNSINDSSVQDAFLGSFEFSCQYFVWKNFIFLDKPWKNALCCAWHFLLGAHSS